MASIRSENSETSESGLSNPVTVIADSQAPPAPANLVLDLIPQGIRAVWDAPATSDDITYAFYRAPAETSPMAEAFLIQDGFAQTDWIDFNPSNAEHWYYVTAVDPVGNESAPSAPQYLDFALLPVADLTIVQQNTSLPIITWTHPESNTIDGCDIYLGAADTGVKLNTSPLTSGTYTDLGYAGDTRTYTVVALNDGAQSLARSITLPKISAQLPESAFTHQRNRGQTLICDYN